MEEAPMSKVLAAMIASLLLSIGQTAMAAEKPTDFSDKGKSAEAKKKGQADSSRGSSADAPKKKGQLDEERRGATPAVPATPADPGTSPAIPATPATPPAKAK
jgi:hypothetical protein